MIGVKNQGFHSSAIWTRVMLAWTCAIDMDSCALDYETGTMNNCATAFLDMYTAVHGEVTKVATNNLCPPKKPHNLK